MRIMTAIRRCRRTAMIWELPPPWDGSFDPAGEARRRRLEALKKRLHRSGPMQPDQGDAPFQRSLLFGGQASVDEQFHLDALVLQPVFFSLVSCHRVRGAHGGGIDDPP